MLISSLLNPFPLSFFRLVSAVCPENSPLIGTDCWCSGVYFSYNGREPRAPCDTYATSVAVGNL